jgi:hypothetical protein
MAIETTFTDDTFAKYIQTEVLQNVADSFEWFTKTTATITPVAMTKALDYALPLNGSIVAFDYTASGDDAAMLALRAAETKGLNIGTEVTFAGDAQVYKIADKSEFDFVSPTGDIRFKILPYNKVAKSAGVVMSWSYYADATEIVEENDPVYTYIKDEALISMGLSSISEVNANNIHEFRAVARIEAWRAALDNAVSMVLNEDREGHSFDRGQVYNSCFDQLSIAENEHQMVFGERATASTNFTTTTVTTVRGSW